MRRYIALIHKGPDSDFGVSFPDFLGCITAGRTLDEALALAPEALAFHAEGLVEDGETLPEPSSLENIMADPDHRDAVAAVVELAEPRREIERINLTMDKRLRQAIDARAVEEGMTRSGWIAAIARRAIASSPASRDHNDSSAGARGAPRSAKPASKRRA
jgi:predicted RNase H-like HicB family nuclease